MEDKARMEGEVRNGGDISREERVEVLRSIVGGNLNPDDSKSLLERLEQSWRREGSVPDDQLDSNKINK